MQTFNAKNVELILNGHKVEGYGEDSAVEMPEDVELMTVTTGADGRHMRYATSEQGGEVKVTLLFNSPSALHFEEQERMSAQEAQPTQWAGHLVDNATGRRYTLEEGAMIRAPRGITFQSGAANDRMFTFDFEQIIPEVQGTQSDAPRAAVVP